MAKPLKAKIKITADTKDADRSLSKLGKSVGTANKSFLSFGKTLSTSVVAGFAAATAAVAGIVAVFNKAISAANFQEEVTVKLTTALKSLGSQAESTAASLALQADEIQRTTTFSNEAAVQAQATIAAFTQNEDQIKALTLASLDLAAAQGGDLDAAAQLLVKTFGSSTNALSRLGLEVDAAVGSTERLEQITGGVARLWGGQAQAAAGTFGGAVKQLKENLDDTLKIIGQLVTGNNDLEQSIRSLSEATIAFNDFLVANKDSIGLFTETIGRSLSLLGGQQTQQEEVTRSLVESIGVWIGAYDELDASVIQIAEQTAFLTDIENANAKAAAFDAKETIRLADAQKAAADAAKKLATEEEKITKALEDLGVVLGESVAKEVERLNDLLASAQERFDAGRISAEAFATIQLEIAESIKEANGAFQDQADVINGVNDKVQEYSAQIVIATGSVDFFTQSEERNAVVVLSASEKRIAARLRESEVEERITERFIIASERRTAALLQEEQQRVQIADRVAFADREENTITGGGFFIPEGFRINRQGQISLDPLRKFG